MDPLISIIIPVYNSGRYIEPCIRSVLEQTYNNLEIIIVDDGSEDNSIDLIKRIHSDYPNRYESMKILHHTQNRGSSAARKTGIIAARGTYFQMVDSDDTLDPQMVMQMYRLISTYDADVAICDYSREMDYLETPELYGIKEEDSVEMMYSSLHFNLSASLFWNKMFRKELFEKWDLFATAGLTIHEEYNVMYKVFWYAAKVVTCKNKYYHWRNNTLSVGHTYKNKFYNNTSAYLQSVEDMSYFFSDNHLGSRLTTGLLLYEKVILISLALYGNLNLLRQHLYLFRDCSFRQWFIGEKHEISFFAKVVGVLARYRCWPLVKLARILRTH